MDDDVSRPDDPRSFRPRGVGEILSDAFTLYRLHWANLILLVAIVVVPLTIAQVLLTEWWVDDVEVAVGETQAVVVEGSLFLAIAGSLLVAVFGILMYTALEAAITRAAAGTFLGRDLEVAESYRFGLSRFWSVILIGLLTALAAAVGFLLLLIPGLIVITRLWVATSVLVLEDRRGAAALRRSWELVKGHSWPVFGTILVSSLLVGLLGSAVTAPFGDNLTAFAIVSALVAVVTTPYAALVGVLVYLDLRIRKEGYGPADLERDLARTSAP